jgi:hypothetical protein
MNEELDNFHEKHEKEGNFKLIVDFKQLDVSFTGKQLEIENIKYKKKKKDLKKEVIDLKKSKNKDNLF